MSYGAYLDLVSFDNEGLIDSMTDDINFHTIFSTQKILFASGSNVSTKLSITSNNIGINTVNPEVSLHINSNDSVRIPSGTSLQRPSKSNYGDIRYNTTTGQYEGYKSNNWISLSGLIDVNQDTKILVETNPGSNNDQIQFYTSNILIMTINSNQKIGIGTTNPTTELEINGNIGGNKFITKNISFNNYNSNLKNNNSNLIYLDGNIGIGTTNTNNTLTVNGNISGNQLTLSSNLAIYGNSSNFIEIEYDSNLGKQCIKFHEYTTVGDYDALIYATSGTSTTSNSVLVLQGSQITFGSKDNFIYSSNLLNYGPTYEFINAHQMSNSFSVSNNTSNFNSCFSNTSNTSAINIYGKSLIVSGGFTNLSNVVNIGASGNTNYIPSGQGGNLFLSGGNIYNYMSNNNASNWCKLGGGSVNISTGMSIVNSSKSNYIIENYPSINFYISTATKLSDTLKNLDYTTGTFTGLSSNISTSDNIMSMKYEPTLKKGIVSINETLKVGTYGTPLYQTIQCGNDIGGSVGWTLNSIYYLTLTSGFTSTNTIVYLSSSIIFGFNATIEVGMSTSLNNTPTTTISGTPIFSQYTTPPVTYNANSLLGLNYLNISGLNINTFYYPCVKITCTSSTNAYGYRFGASIIHQ